MAREFKAVDRDQAMLLPPDLREWLPAGHLVWLVVEVVDQLDLSALVKGYRRGGTGREAFDPRMLTALLIYGYAVGVRSSRSIERACLTDVAFRVVSAQQQPDHSTIARFRARHAAALADLFGQVLTICAQAGLGRVGSVAVDGTKIAGQASPRKTYAEKRLRKLAEDIVADAAAVDAAEDAEHGPDRRGDELPPTLQPGSGRAGRIRQALHQIEQEKAAAAAEDVETMERVLARAQSAAERERRTMQHRHDQVQRPQSDRKPVEEHLKVRRADGRVAEVEAALVQARAGLGRRARQLEPRVNISDPDSHLMFVRGKGYLQGYNAQLVVSDDHLIVASDVNAATNDTLWFEPMMRQALTNVAEHLPGRQIEVVLADAGYCTRDALTCDGPDRLIATGRHPETPAKTGKDPAIAAMAQRLAPDSPDRLRYQRRQATVEPVIGQLKDRIGLRRFTRRGLLAARHELSFAAAVHNIRRIASHRLISQPAVAC